MHNRFDIRAHSVNTRMQVKLQRWLASSLNDLTFHVNGANVVHSELTALARTDVDQHGVVGQQNAGMTVVINDVLRFQHADAVDQFLLEFYVV